MSYADLCFTMKSVVVVVVVVVIITLRHPMYWSHNLLLSIFLNKYVNIWLFQIGEKMEVR